MNKKKRAHADQRYIDALLTNDRRVIREIYKKFSDRIAGYVRSNNGNAKDAQDVFQEGLIAIYQRARGGNFTLTCPFEAYLYLVCRGKWLNELKRRQRQEVTNSTAEGYKGETEAAPLADATLREQARDELFDAKFRELSDRCRELLRISWTGVGMEEVANRMAISYGYARKKKSECTARLIELIRSAPAFRRLESD
jgi:RNA polymerase sigma factor (sigma-70 family)